VDDPGFVRSFECVGDLPRDGQRVVGREATLQQFLDRRTLDEFHDQRPHAP
jgi:hypothetical protein